MRALPSPHRTLGERSGRDPAVCAAHEAGATDLVIRRSRDGLITLGPHGEDGCVFTVQAAVLFDLLGTSSGSIEAGPPLGAARGTATARSRR